LSPRHDEPQAASRPFDKQRDGFVLGEGAAVLVLESRAHAAARGARTYAQLAGAGIANDAHHVAAPDPTGAGAARAMTLALQDAGLEPSDVAHLNAHATSTPAGDVAEARAIRAAFGAHADDLPVTATKSCSGHLLGAAGALEALVTCLALRDHVVPAIRNLDDPDDDVALDLVQVTPRGLPGRRAALSNSFGFGGHDVALAFTEA
jgi:3-oxoacyl-[acyl-carrier-protein] synthase II